MAAAVKIAYTQDILDQIADPVILASAMNARTLLPCIAMAALALGLSNEAAALNPAQNLMEYAHAIWRPGDDGLYGKPLSVAQTADGYLWVGTTAGLFRFDGVRFSIWRPEGSGHPFDGPVAELYSSRDGSLWVSVMNSELVRLRGHKVETIATNSAHVTAITEDGAGLVWYNNYIPLTGAHQLCSVGADSIPHCLASPSYCMHELISLGDALWCGADTGLLRLEHGKFQAIPIAVLQSHTNQSGVMALAQDDEGGLYVGIGGAGNDSGLRQLRGTQLTAVKIGGLDGAKLDVSSLFKDRQGALWIGTKKQGIYRIYKGQVERLPMTLEGDSYLYQFLEDDSGSIWLTGDNTLQRFSDRAVATIHSTMELHADEVDGVSVTRDGALWLAGEEALLTLSPGQRNFSAAANLPANSQVTSILEDHSGVMWVGIDDSLYVLKARRFTPVTLSNGKPPGMIVSLAEDSAFNIWAVSLGPPRRILRYDKQSGHLTPVTQLPPASRIAADPAGGIYVAALNGDLVHFDSDGDRRDYPHVQNHSARTSHLLVTSDGAVYASTPFGLETLKDGHIQTISTRNGLPCDRLYDTAVDLRGNYWLYMECGLVRIPKLEMSRWRRNPDAVLAVQVLDAEDGVEPLDAPFNASAVTPDGTLWFANGDLQKVDPNSAFQTGKPPPVHIEQVAADGRPYPLYLPINFRPLTRDIQIDYTGLNFIAPDKVQFRYELQGFDEHWIDAGTRRQAFYTALPPGHYRFHVMARNSTGAWNTAGDSLNFYLAPAFYQTLWFRLLCGILVVALLWVFFQIRVRQLVAQARARQSVQYAERERIARTLHDTLLQSVQGLIWRFSAAVDKLHPTERRELQELLDRSDEVLAEARNSILDLREPANRSLALAEEISALGKETVGNSGIRVTVLANGKPYKLGSDVYENIVLVVREALLNAVRHAKAQTLEVQIDYLERELKISIRDDGQGIEEDTLQHGRRGHWGLLGMRERSKSLRGNLRILSRSGAGTEIELVIPRAYASK